MSTVYLVDDQDLDAYATITRLLNANNEGYGEQEIGFYDVIDSKRDYGLSQKEIKELIGSITEMKPDLLVLDIKIKDNCTAGLDFFEKLKTVWLLRNKGKKLNVVFFSQFTQENAPDVLKRIVSYREKDKVLTSFCCKTDFQKDFLRIVKEILNGIMNPQP